MRSGRANAVVMMGRRVQWLLMLSVLWVGAGLGDVRAGGGVGAAEGTRDEVDGARGKVVLPFSDPTTIDEVFDQDDLAWPADGADAEGEAEAGGVLAGRDSVGGGDISVDLRAEQAEHWDVQSFEGDEHWRAHAKDDAETDVDTDVAAPTPTSTTLPATPTPTPTPLTVVKVTGSLTMPVSAEVVQTTPFQNSFKTSVASVSQHVAPPDVTITGSRNAATKKSARLKTTGTVVEFEIQVLSTGGANSSAGLALGSSIQASLTASVNSTGNSSFASVFNAQMLQEDPTTTISISSNDLILTVTAVTVSEVAVVTPASPSQTPADAPTPTSIPSPPPVSATPSSTGTMLGRDDDDSGNLTMVIVLVSVGACLLMFFMVLYRKSWIPNENYPNSNEYFDTEPAPTTKQEAEVYL